MIIRPRLHVLLVFLLFTACDAGNDSLSANPVNEVTTANTDEFAANFKVRNREIRADILAELDKRQIPYRRNEDESIGYHDADGEVIDAVFNYAVGLYAARN